MSLFILVSAGFLIALGVSLTLTPWIRSVANRKQWTDAPDRERKIHTEDIPRTGGIAIVGAFLVGLAYFALIGDLIQEPFAVPAWYIIAGAVFIGAIGFLDDLFGLHFSHKFTAQVLLGIFMMIGGYRFDILPAELAATPLDIGWWITAVVTVMWIVGVTNAMNLLDGMDGLAAGVAIIAVMALTAVQVIQGSFAGVMLAGVAIAALAGFLIYNFNPASIFMGDTGSFFLGFLLAVIALPEPGGESSVLTLIIAVIALGVPIADTSVTVLRRYLTGRPLFFPDQDHIHHRMVSQRHLSHRRTVLILYAAAAVLGVGACLLTAAVSPLAIGSILLALALISYSFLHWLGYVHMHEFIRPLKARSVRRLSTGINGHRSAAPVPSILFVNGNPVEENTGDLEK